VPLCHFFEDAAGRSYVFVSSPGDYEGWLVREAGASKFRPIAELAIGVERGRLRCLPWHLSPCLGKVRARSRLVLTRSVTGFEGPRGLTVNARGEIFVAEGGQSRGSGPRWRQAAAPLQLSR
jgi:hypothetical protein